MAQGFQFYPPILNRAANVLETEIKLICEAEENDKKLLGHEPKKTVLSHPHPLSKRKSDLIWKCNKCQMSYAQFIKSWNCTEGCQFYLCPPCFDHEGLVEEKKENNSQELLLEEDEGYSLIPKFKKTNMITPCIYFMDYLEVNRYFISQFDTILPTDIIGEILQYWIPVIQETEVVNQKDPLTIPIISFTAGAIYAIPTTYLVSGFLGVTGGPISATVASVILGATAGAFGGFTAEKYLTDCNGSGLQGLYYGSLGGISSSTFVGFITSTLTSKISTCLGGGWLAKLIGLPTGYMCALPTNLVLGSLLIGSQIESGPGITPPTLPIQMDSEEEETKKRTELEDWILLGSKGEQEKESTLFDLSFVENDLAAIGGGSKLV